MNGTTTWGLVTMMALCASTLGGTEVAAQAASAAGDEARAAALAARAGELSRHQGEFEEAAAVYREAAEAAAGQPASVEPLRMAGRLAYYTGDFRRAYRDLVEAGETALAWGDVVGAANAFLDAAWAARAGKLGSQARLLIARAEKLSHSPLIPDGERRSLRGRIAEEQP